MLGVFQVDVHSDGQRHDQNDVQAVSLPENLREPAGLGLLIDDAHRVGADWVFPKRHAIAGDLNGHIVHHQREERLVGIPLRLEGGGDHTPDAAAHQTGRGHNQQQRGRGNGGAEGTHDSSGEHAADQNLPLRADVPEFHLEGGSKADADAQQHHGVPDGDPAAALGAESTVKDSPIHFDGIQLCNRVDKSTADQKGEGNGNQPDAVSGGTGNTVALGDPQKRFFLLPGLAHICAASFLNRVISRPTSSLVVVRASTMPLT